ncbi:MerR family transcriptional regulator [Sphingomonas sp. ST-64]|uniref:MerR family transcriptional regulator n=1 Tax=Sphingomonas plantiphila TaxID=3163295 RepID=A0ABW8YMI6_9SPHN
MIESLDIAEVARRSGITARALRFYEARGLLRPLRTASGRRCYGPAELEQVHRIVLLKRAGLSLAQIQRLTAHAPVDLGRLVDVQLETLAEQAAEIEAARALLRTVKSRIDSGERIDVATFCSLIRQGDMQMSQQQQWDKVADRFFTAEEKAQFEATMAQLPADFDHADYTRGWADLGARIKAALPLDPASVQAQAFVAEWREMLAPFNAVATPAMKAGVQRMYERMDTWQGQADPGFDAEVFAFIQSALRAKAG